MIEKIQTSFFVRKKRVLEILLKRKIIILTFLVIGILINAFLWNFSQKIIMLSLIIIWLLAASFYRLNGKFFIIFSLIILISSIIFSPIINSTIISDALSSWSYILITIGVLDKLFEKES